MTSNVPVLLLIFNRPETTLQVIAALSKVKPQYLYIAADGPRADRFDDVEKTEAARKIATEIDWPCEVKTLFRDENLGCRRAVSAAIDWFFEHVEEGIIMEDDCIPDPSFFPFAGELLERFRNDERVMVIAAKHHGAARASPYSYFFSCYNHCWGWASWRRAWQYYDRDMTHWPALRESDWLLGIGSGGRAFQQYWTMIFDSAYAGKVDSWAYRWTFSCWAQSGLSILPARNLVTNIGFGEDSTHTKNSRHSETSARLETIGFPLVHPPCMIRDVHADAWSNKNIYGMGASPLKDIARKLPGVHKLAKLLRSR